ncbi:MAG: tungstate ABC transporter substrate-binding protein WtpA [Coriobacteriia bacterium]|nr:tungstate ABC transporter substrate-binding protein WtpA [Coriobacteriia bacterium]
MSSTRLNVRLIAVGLMMTLLMALGVTGCAQEEEPVEPQEKETVTEVEEEELSGTLTIYHAGSLAVPFEQLEALYEAENPGVDIVRESGGSATMISTGITEQDAGEDPPDIIASADYALIPDRMYEGGYADWTMIFARNTMVLCYRPDAPFAEDIENGDRAWYDVLVNEDVSWGHSDPDADPCGYRSLMVFQLAQQYYYDQAETFGLTPDENAKNLYDVAIPGSNEDRGRTNQGNEIVRAKSVDLVSLLESGDLDYAFEYQSVAVQHGLDYIPLDEAVNLSGVGDIGDSGLTFKDFYAQATVDLKSEEGYKSTPGAAVVYGLTILKEAPSADIAEDFIEFLLSEAGAQVIEVENGQPVVNPPKCDMPGNLPPALAELAVEL